MSRYLYQRVKPVALFVSLSVILGACSGGTSTFERSVVSSLVNMGLISPAGPSRAIDYSPRPPLVLPSQNQLNKPILPPENLKVSPRELARIYYPDQSKLSLKDYEKLIAERRALSARGLGIKKLAPGNVPATEEERVRNERLNSLLLPRQKFFQPLPGAGKKSGSKAG